MARLDTISAGVWNGGTLLTGSVSDGTTLCSVTALPAGWWLFGISGSCDIAWVYDVKLLTQGGSLITNQIQRRRPAAGNEDFYFPSAVFIQPGAAEIRVVLIGTITVVGLQVSIFTQLGSLG